MSAKGIEADESQLLRAEGALRVFVSAFSILTPDEIELIVGNAVIRFFPKGTILLSEGEIAQHCYFVLEGLVREYYLDDGREHTTAFFDEKCPVNSFSSHLESSGSKHYLVCAEDCLLTIGEEQLEQEMIRRIPRLEAIIRQEVERMTGQMQDELAHFIRSTPEQRYAHFCASRPGLLQRVPQHQIASLIGIAPESLSRLRKRQIKAESQRDA
jgi:CRP-like cAMP-binding protein